jgi:hypothetical protein
MGCPSITLALTLRSTHSLGDLCVSSIQGRTERIGIGIGIGIGIEVEVELFLRTVVAVAGSSGPKAGVGLTKL